MDYKNYQNSRNATWQILINCNAKELPIDIHYIYKHFDIKMGSYSNNSEIISAFGNVSSDGFTLFEPYLAVFYNDTKSRQRIRFTLAHELGHIILKHNYSGEELEAEANVFASRLLVPAFLLHELHITSVKQIVKAFDVSEKVANLRFARHSILTKRQKYYTSPLEAKAKEQFCDYINRQKQAY